MIFLILCSRERAKERTSLNTSNAKELRTHINQHQHSTYNIETFSHYEFLIMFVHNFIKVPNHSVGILLKQVNLPKVKPYIKLNAPAMKSPHLQKEKPSSGVGTNPRRKGPIFYDLTI